MSSPETPTSITSIRFQPSAKNSVGPAASMRRRISTMNSVVKTVEKDLSN